MSADAPFLEQIALDPADDTAKLIYADWLEEQGDGRSELIRVQCALAAPNGRPLQLQAWRQREAVLLRRHAQEWLGPLSSKTIHVVFRGGLVDALLIGAAEFVRVARHLAERAPALRRLSLSRARGCDADVAESISLLASQLGFPSLRELSVSSCDLSGMQVAQLVQAPYLAKLTSFDLSWNLGIGDLGVDWLGDAQDFKDLEVLDLRGISLSKRAVRTLAEKLQRLRLLVISQQPQRRRQNSSEQMLKSAFGKRLMVCPTTL